MIDTTNRMNRMTTPGGDDNVVMQIAVIALIYCSYLSAAETGQNADIVEYCSFESFNATCRPGEVIHILSARYGRMRIGRCVNINLGYMPCVNDVTHVVAARCEARTQCELTVGDGELRESQPCPADVTWHLEVSHTCVKVLTKDDADCRHSDVTSAGGSSMVAQQPGFIASTSGRVSVSQGGGGGASSSPGIGIMSAVGDGGRGNDECVRWSLSVPAGQRIQLGLVRMLSRSTTSRPSQQQQQQHWYADVCLDLLTVSEAERQIPLQGCTTYSSTTSGSKADDGQLRKQSSSVATGGFRTSTEPPPLTALYTSATNHIYVTLAPIKTNDENNYVMFLIQYEAVGCPYYDKPSRSWIEATDSDHIIVHCNDSDVTWSATCQGGKWESSSANSNSCGGSSGSSDRGRSKVWHEHLVDANSALPMSILIAVAVGVALGIFLGGVLLAVVGSRMNSRRQKYRSNDVTSAYAASTLMTSDDDKMFQCSLGDRQPQFSSCTLDVSTRSTRSCCRQSEYSIPSATTAEITCLPPEMVANEDKSPPHLSLATYCRPGPAHAYRGAGTFLRHQMYETPAVTYSP